MNGKFFIRYNIHKFTDGSGPVIRQGKFAIDAADENDAYQKAYAWRDSRRDEYGDARTKSGKYIGMIHVTDF